MKLEGKPFHFSSADSSCMLCVRKCILSFLRQLSNAHAQHIRFLFPLPRTTATRPAPRGTAIVLGAPSYALAIAPLCALAAAPGGASPGSPRRPPHGSFPSRTSPLTAMIHVSYFVHDPCPLLRTYCLLYTSPSPRDATLSRMPSSA